MADPAAPRTPDKQEASPVPRTLDGMERAILEGKVVDSEFKPIKPDENMTKSIPAHNLDAEEQKSLKGELKTGDVGWIELDEKGSPVGTAVKYPKKDVPMAPVSTIVENVPTVLATPAGAFLTDAKMNPSPMAYKYHSSSYNRDYAPFGERDMKKWGLEAKTGAGSISAPNPGVKSAPVKTPA
jgi:hypothetical protein